MTNYIEEMMRTAAIKKIKDAPLLDAETLEPVVYREYYPDFTVAKQMEIIKLICVSKYEFTMDIENQKCYLFATPHPRIYQVEQIEIQNKDFTQALAQLTTELMNTGELDKQKVKEILEG